MLAGFLRLRVERTGCREVLSLRRIDSESRKEWNLTGSYPAQTFQIISESSGLVAGEPSCRLFGADVWLGDRLGGGSPDLRRASPVGECVREVRALCEGGESAVGVCILIWASEATVRTGMFHIFHTPGREGGCLKKKNNDLETLLCRVRNFVR